MSLINLVKLLINKFNTPTTNTTFQDKVIINDIVDKVIDINTTPIIEKINTPTLGKYTLSPRGACEIGYREALARTCYIDSGGVKTFGLGSTVSDIKDLAKWSWDKTMSDREIVNLFLQGSKKYVTAVNMALKVPVTQYQFDALVSITYNIGTAGMASSTFMKNINAKVGNAQICKAIKMWNKDNGKVVQGLVNRRAAECALFTTGEYKNIGSVPLIKVNPTTHKPIYTYGLVNIIQYM